MPVTTAVRPREELRRAVCAAPAFTLLAIIAGIYGFVYEFLFYYLNGHMQQFYWRGSHFLPWITIYACGGLLIYALTYRLKKHPLLVCLAGGLGCGALEWIAGAALFYIGGQRAWDYNTEIWNFGNIGGFICLRSVVVFGLSSLFLLYAVWPFISFLQRKLGTRRFVVLVCILGDLFAADFLYNAVVIRLFPALPSANAFYTGLGLPTVSY